MSQSLSHGAVCWSSLFGGEAGRGSRSARTVGVFKGEGIGPEVIAAALKVLSALETAGRAEFEIQMGGAIGREAEARNGSLTADSEAFCENIFAGGGAILAGPAEGRFVYDLRRRFD